VGDGLAGLIVNGILDGPDASVLENGLCSTEVQGIFEVLGREDFVWSAIDGTARLEHVDGLGSLGDRDVFEGEVSSGISFESNAHGSFAPSPKALEFEGGIKTPELQPNSGLL